MNGESVDAVGQFYETMHDRLTEYNRRKGHFGIRRGLYDGEHASEAAAVDNMRRKMLEATTIAAEDQVLDIGCGFGEDATRIAELHGAEVVGINVSDEQLAVARRLADHRDVTDRVAFRLDDFHALETVPDRSVDVVWGAEALCHAFDVNAVFSNLTRVLSDGGRVVFADLFLRAADVDRDELETFTRGTVSHVAPLNDVREALERNGFAEISHEDVTNGIVPSSKRRYRISLLGSPFLRLKAFISGSDVDRRTLEMGRGHVAHHRLLRDGAFIYAIVTARLPEQP